MKQTLCDVQIVWGFCFISLVILNLFSGSLRITYNMQVDNIAGEMPK